MVLKDALSSGALYTPYPLQVEGFKFKGARFDFSTVCTENCFQGQGKYYCKHGLAYKWIDINNEKLLICGYIDSGSKINKEDRTKLLNRSSTDSKVVEWSTKLKKLLSLSNRSKDAVNDLGSLHEITRWASQVHTIAQRMLLKDKSMDFAANFQTANKDMRSLFKASEMLVDAFDYLGIYFNPSSAAFGRKRSVDLYKLVDKIRIILMEAEGAALNKKIYITGELRRNIDLYESFKIIPFCFLQNAIKYSFDGEINISFASTTNSIELGVESSGPPISDEEKVKIFEKGYRGAWSKGMHHEGLGVGLYIAKIVADAHDLEIRVKSVARNYSREGIPVHSNTFSIRFAGGSAAERRAVPR
ncbi:MAG TPA: sensor histidine kinase [Telluria sp.]|jgi:hypothetical protein